MCVDLSKEGRRVAVQPPFSIFAGRTAERGLLTCPVVVRSYKIVGQREQRCHPCVVLLRLGTRRAAAPSSPPSLPPDMPACLFCLLSRWLDVDGKQGIFTPYVPLGRRFPCPGPVASAQLSPRHLLGVAPHWAAVSPSPRPSLSSIVCGAGQPR